MSLARLLRHRYGADSLVYARNVTDVDDKIIEAARVEGVDPSAITQRFEQHYLGDMGRSASRRRPSLPRRPRMSPRWSR
jgi:cysteinyl-tRNA synthetase